MALFATIWLMTPRKARVTTGKKSGSPNSTKNKKNKKTKKRKNKKTKKTKKQKNGCRIMKWCERLSSG